MPGRVHLEKVLEALPQEQRPIADQLVAGGLPAVRRALAAEKEKAAGDAAQTSNHAAILTVAEQMAPSIKDAMWLDRAEAAVEALEHLSLRDLRATVVGATPRDEHGRELDRRLREALDQRVTKLRETWATDMSRALEDNRVLQALRLSSRPPEPSARFPAALVGPLAEAAGNAMTSDTPAERWAVLLEAATQSPIRRSIKPAGIPAGADEALLEAARAAAGHLPALAPLLGMAMPPPPRPAPRPPRPAPGPRRIPARPAATFHADGRPDAAAIVDAAAPSIEDSIGQADGQPEAAPTMEAVATPTMEAVAPSVEESVVVEEVSEPVDQIEVVDLI